MNGRLRLCYRVLGRFSGGAKVGQPSHLAQQRLPQPGPLCRDQGGCGEHLRQLRLGLRLGSAEIHVPGGRVDSTGGAVAVM